MFISRVVLANFILWKCKSISPRSWSSISSTSKAVRAVTRKSSENRDSPHLSSSTCSARTETVRIQWPWRPSTSLLGPKFSSKWSTKTWSWTIWACCPKWLFTSASKVTEMWQSTSSPSSRATLSTLPSLTQRGETFRPTFWSTAWCIWPRLRCATELSRLHKL